MPAPLASTLAEDDARYRALKARDARFDGRFFTAVISTGIYCRPVCRVRVPKRENCRFFMLAAQAEAAGFRPCLRCRPELAPAMAQCVAPLRGATIPWSMQDAASILALQAAHLLDAQQCGVGTAQPLGRVADRLGISERHLRRIFEIQWGISPSQYWQTRRLLTAKQLLTDTILPVAQIAMLSGFSSVRRFNDAFVGHYRLQPSVLRKSASPGGGHAVATGFRLKATYRPPFDVHAMLDFFARRQIPGVEAVDPARRTMTRTLSLHNGTVLLAGWIRAQFDPARYAVEIDCSASLASVLPEILLRIRSLFDLDADPETINASVGADFPGCSGMRVPGALDGFELGVRAILGQQVTVSAARTLGTRLAERFGTAMETPFDGINRLFPSPQTLAAASTEALGALGIVRQRQRAIQALAQAMDGGGLVLQPGVDIAHTLETLLALPGIGPWTAHYIAMRALRWPDAFPAGDVALHQALDVRTAKHPALAAEQAAQRWRPWRSYAVVRAWSSLSVS